MGSLPIQIDPPVAAHRDVPCVEPVMETLPELRPHFRLSTLLLGLTSCAICLAVARGFPEVSIAMVFVMAIALIRVLYGIQQWSNAGKTLTFLRELLLYLMSLLVVIALGGFVTVAFATTLGACLGLGLLVSANVDARQTEWIFGGFIAGWILGLLAAAIAGGWMFKLLWFEKLSPPVASKWERIFESTNGPLLNKRGEEIAPSGDFPTPQ